MGAFNWDNLKGKLDEVGQQVGDVVNQAVDAATPAVQEAVSKAKPVVDDAMAKAQPVMENIVNEATPIVKGAVVVGTEKLEDLTGKDIDGDGSVGSKNA